MPTIRHVAERRAADPREPDGQVMLGAAEQEAGAQARLAATGVMASEGILAHVVGGTGRVPERPRRKLADSISAPGTLGARFAAVCALPPLLPL